MSIRCRVLAVVALVLGAMNVQHLRAQEQFPEDPDGAVCSTCLSPDGLGHEFANNCCESGDFCMRTPHTSYSAGWCTQMHSACF